MHIMYNGMYDKVMLSKNLDAHDFLLFLGSLSYMISPGRVVGSISLKLRPNPRGYNPVIGLKTKNVKMLKSVLWLS